MISHYLIDSKTNRRIRHLNQYDIAKIYSSFKQQFCHGMIKLYPIDFETCQDFYQDVFVIFLNKVKKKRIDIECKPETYLFAIGRNKAKEWIRMRKKEYKAQSLFHIRNINEDDPNRNLERESKVLQAAEAIKKLNPRGQQLLELFYYHKMDIREITKIMRYKNPNTTRTQKYKYLRQLKRICSNRK